MLQGRFQALLLLETVKILYVSQYFPPEMGAPAARVAELSRYWAQDGHDVTVLTGFPNHPTGVVPPEYCRKFRHLVAREKTNGVKVVRTWLLPFPNRRTYERILNYSSFCISAAGTGLFTEHPDVVIASSPQLLVGLSGWWLARCKRARFVFEVRDLWPESLTAVGVGNPDSAAYRLLARIAGFLYRNSDHIVVVTPAFKEYLIQYWHVAPKKISVVENGVEGELFSPKTESSLRAELGANGKFVASYIGTMGNAHGLQTLIEAAARLQASAAPVLFLLVGEGAEKQQLVSQVRSRGLTNVRFVDQQSRGNIPAYICASDACLVLLKKNDLFKTVIPSKMLEFMACGRPVILGVEGQSRKILEEAQAGICIEPENPMELAEAISRLAGDGQLREILGRNGRRHVLQHFSRRQTATAYLDVLGRLLGEEKQGALAA
jgi:colanic acid biosynthesis glycosyl transferase WcaI